MKVCIIAGYIETSTGTETIGVSDTWQLDDCYFVACYGIVAVAIFGRWWWCDEGDFLSLVT